MQQRTQQRFGARHFCLLALVTLGLATQTSAQVVSGTVVQTIETSLWSSPSPDPAGITYRPDTGRLVTCDSEVDEMALYGGVNLWFHTNSGAITNRKDTLAFSNEPTGIAWDPAGKRLWISDDNRDVVFEVRFGADGLLGTEDDIVVDLDGLAAAGCEDPEDVTYDNVNNVLYVAGGAGLEICRIEPGLNGVFNGPPPTGDDVVSSIDLIPFGLQNPEGIVYDPFENTLVVADRSGTGNLHEFSLDGTRLREIDVVFPPGARPSGVTLAPGTPNPVIRSFYVTSGGVDNDVNPDENDGRIFEVIAPPLGGNAAPTVDAGPAVTLPSASDVADLAGFVSDDGHPYPPSALSASWSTLSGPGTVTFGDDTDPNTTATFSSAGNYVLQLLADDSELNASDTVEVTVNGSNPPGCGIGPELVALLLALRRAQRLRS